MHLPTPASSARRAALVLLVALGGLAALPRPAGAEPLAPRDLVGLDLNLQIETAEGPAAGSYPNQGAIVRHILPHGQWTSTGAGGPNHRDSRGVSEWRRAPDDTLVEIASDATGQPAASTFRYRFETPCRGHWTWQIDHGQATLGGSFTTAPSAPTTRQQLAPATNAGLYIPLVIKSAVAPSLPAGSYPAAGLVLQAYAGDGTLTLQGFGPGTLNSHGTYTFKRLSANTAVEETLQISDAFALPYTMVYTFETPSSGVWYQNFANGLIRFSGTFDTFPR